MPVAISYIGSGAEHARHYLALMRWPGAWPLLIRRFGPAVRQLSYTSILQVGPTQISAVAAQDRAFSF
jgi:hypothetical protein